MKKIEEMYICYAESGENYIYSNPHTGRAEADKTNVILSEGAEIITVASGQRMVEYRKGIYPDNTLYTRDGKVYTRTYTDRDMPGNPTGAPVMIAEMVE